jgi:HSP20 family molecular chaperone IbpA
MEANQDRVETKVEACVEGMEEETIRVVADQYGDCRLDVRHHGEPNKRSQGDGAFQQRLAARQCVSSYHLTTPVDTKATIALKQKNCVLYAVCTKMLYM